VVGIGTAVATCGTALTERHFATLKNFARRIVLAFDADAAGQGAAARFYEWERRHDVDVAVASLPPGADPGELARKDPDRLRTAVAEAVPFLQFRLNRLLAAADLRTVEGRARAAEEAMALIGEHPSELVRDQYVMEVADRTRVDADKLRRGVTQGRATPPAAAPTRRRERHDSPSLLALRIAVHRPELVADTLHEVLFAEPVELAAYMALAEAPTLHEAIEAADPDAAELLSRLAVEELDPELDADDVLWLLVAEAAGVVLRDLDATARASVDPMAQAPTMAWLKQRLQELPTVETRRSALDQLVPFLVARAEEVGT
jgi:DNA primase